jgi:hypothetical protein
MSESQLFIKKAQEELPRESRSEQSLLWGELSTPLMDPPEWSLAFSV